MMRLSAAADERIRLATKFGEFEADPRNLVAFPQGVPGFERCRRFAILTSPAAAPLQCLHAVDGVPASFLALDPRLVLPEYRCRIGETDAVRLQCADPAGLLWLALLTFDEKGAAMANLRAPIVINPHLMIGCQLMPHDTLYPLRHPVAIGA
jgi:flagellar assembly factor FliW